ncbi:MAG TPA: 30S ribosomal protein S18 [Acidimicrobiales bacterium]|nr:30S ribosomal protein S18 [Acidimicrobiales bacterium]
MARNPKVAKKTSSRKPRPAEGKGRVRRGRPKVCLFCAEHSDWVDYKDVNRLGRFLNNRGRIRARGATGTCAQHQRDVAAAIKTARELALLPYVVLAQAESSDRRGGGRRGQDRAPVSAEAAVLRRDGAEPGPVDAETPGVETADATEGGAEATAEAEVQAAPETDPVVATT